MFQYFAPLTLLDAMMDLIDKVTDLVIHVEVKDFDKPLIGKVQL